MISFLKAGQSIAQVSDAGLPSISDPGHDLVKAAIEEEIAVVTVPGASAGISALIASGLAPQPHIFYGFLPRKSGQQKQFFDSKKTIQKLRFLRIASSCSRYVGKYARSLR